MDLGGYQGPELKQNAVALRILRQSWDDATNAAFDATISKFEAAYPKISVKQELVPYGDLPLKIQTYVATDNTPDIMMGSSGSVASYKSGDIALPLKDYFTKAFFDDFSKPMADSVTIDGSFYAIPMESQVEMMKFNKAIFKKAGVATPPETGNPKDGWTDKQWFDAFAKLRTWIDASGNKTMFPLAPSLFGNGGPGSNYSQLEVTWIRSQGSPDAPKDSEEYKTWAGVSPDGLNVDGYLNTSLAVTGMKNYQDLFTKKWSPVEPVPDMFKSGLAAADIGGNVDPAIPFDWGYSPLPRANSVVVSNASDSLVLSRASKHPDEAAALLGALTSVTAKTAWAKVWGSVPAQKSVTAELQKPAPFSTKFQSLIDMSAYTVGVPKTPGWSAYANQMNITVKNIALGADPKSSLADATTKIDRLLSKYKK